MKGHVRRRPNGRWAAVIYAGIDGEGKKRYTWHTAATRREAEALCARLVSERHAGTAVEPSKMTVSDWLAEWLAQTRSTVRASTWSMYESLIRCHVLPALGRMALSKLRPLHIQRLHGQLLATGRSDGHGGLSGRTVGHIHTVLRSACRDAVRLQVLASDPTEGVRPPRQQRRQAQGLGWDVAEQLLEASTATRLHMPILLAVTTGMRRGEILGLRWSDVDLDRGTLEIAQTLTATAGPGGWAFGTPKTDRARRRVALPEMTVAALRAHRRQQLATRFAFGPDYQAHDLAICHDDGRPWAPNAMRQTYRRLTARLGLGHVRFHDLRHLHATALLRAGIHPKVVADRLGHSEISTTLDTYSHVLPDMQSEAAAAVDRLCKSRANPRG